MRVAVTLACLVCWTEGSAAAHPSSQHDAVQWTGAFASSDSGCTPCIDPSIMTGACACPPGSMPLQTFRILTDCELPFHGGLIIFCAAVNATLTASAGLGSYARSRRDHFKSQLKFNQPLLGAAQPPLGAYAILEPRQAIATGTVVFLGGYQKDDAVPTGQGCRVLNPLTQECTCPADSTAMPYRVLADTKNESDVGSNIVICHSTTTIPRDGTAGFGGAFQVDDPPAGCRVPNPVTGACSCSTSLHPQRLRVLVDGPSGSTIYMCGESGRPVELCDGVVVDPTGQVDAAAAFQKCIDALPARATLAIAVGVYALDAQLLISKSVTLSTQGLDVSSPPCTFSDAGVRCAGFRATSKLYAQYGMLYIRNTSNVAIDHIVLDGNRGARLGGKAAQTCAAGTNSYGFNAASHGGDGNSFTNSVSAYAVCGTGFEWTGADALFRDSSFLGNGDHFTSHMWSDGLTLNSAPGVTVSNCIFHDNSDVNLILGGAPGGVVANNTLTMENNQAFAGFMCDNFGGGTSGNFTQFVMADNSIYCNGKCHYALELGPTPWYPSVNIFGGTFTRNTISGGGFVVNIDGAGTAADPVRFFENNLSHFAPDLLFLCGKRFPGTLLNIAPNSIVDRNHETSPIATTDVWSNCP